MASWSPSLGRQGAGRPRCSVRSPGFRIHHQATFWSAGDQFTAPVETEGWSSGRRHLSLAQRAQECRIWAGGAGPASGSARAAGHPIPAAGAGALRRSLSKGALGWHEKALPDRHRPRQQPRCAPDGRAVRRARLPHKCQLQEELLRILGREPKTTVFVTHDIEEALFLADRIVVMGSGTIERIVPVPFARPRANDLRVSLEFSTLKARLWEELEDRLITDEAVAAPEVGGREWRSSLSFTPAPRRGRHACGRTAAAAACFPCCAPRDLVGRGSLVSPNVGPGGCSLAVSARCRPEHPRAVGLRRPWRRADIRQRGAGHRRQHYCQRRTPAGRLAAGYCPGSEPGSSWDGTSSFAT